MERGRILILGSSKENTYEIRSLLDNHRFELEIALSTEVGKAVLSTRRMNLIMVHTEALSGADVDFVDYLRATAADVPLAILGDEAISVAKRIAASPDVRCFDKPYIPNDVISFIHEL